MKEAYWGYFIIVLGVVAISVVLLFQDVTTTNDQNYYLVKEVTEAAMIDSIDKSFMNVGVLKDSNGNFVTESIDGVTYTHDGNVKIIKEKFVENFIRRYAESASLNKAYNIKIYDVIEQPPKVSLSVGSKSNVFTFTGEEFNIVNKVDAILENKD